LKAGKGDFHLGQLKEPAWSPGQGWWLKGTFGRKSDKGGRQITPLGGLSGKQSSVQYLGDLVKRE